MIKAIRAAIFLWRTKILLARFGMTLFMIFMIFFPQHAAAQTESDILQTIEKIEKIERRLRDIEKEEIDRQKIRKIPSGSESKELELLKKRDEKCITVSKIHVEGVTVYPDRAVRLAVAPYAGKCLGKAGINNVLRSLTNLYIKGGYITTRAYIPQQGIQDGIFKVVIVEGQLEDIVMRDGKKIQFKNIFPNIKTGILNMRDIEQGLDQLNRMSSTIAKSEIKPGSKPGQSIIVISQKTGRKLKPSIRIDNSGTKNTGKYMITLGLAMENLSGFSDILSGSFKFNTDYAPKTKMNRRFSLNYDIPYGYWNFVFGANSSESTIILANEHQTKYKNWNVFSSAKRVLYRDGKSKFSGGIELHAKGKESYINNKELSVGTYRRYYASLTGNYSTVLPDASTFVLDASASLGLGAKTKYRDNFGRPRPAGVFDPNRYFTKFTFDSSWQKLISLWNLSTFFRLSAKGQFSNHILFGEDLFQIGGIGTVQGYGSNSLSYKSGINVRTKLIFSGLGKILPFKIVPYAGFDFGMILDPKETTSDRIITSLSAGFTSKISKNMTFRLDYGRALTYPSSFKFRDHSLNFGLHATF